MALLLGCDIFIIQLSEVRPS